MKHWASIKKSLEQYNTLLLSLRSKIQLFSNLRFSCSSAIAFGCLFSSTSLYFLGGWSFAAA